MTPALQRPAAASLLGLGLLNFFLADARDGLGPFLDAYLSTKGWAAIDLGLLATIGGVLGLLAGVPAGALIDRSHHKRLMVIAPVILITLMSFLCLAWPGRAMVFATQALAAVAGVLIGPAVAAITLGLVGAGQFGRQLGRNESWNHAGNLVLMGGTWAASVWLGLPGVAGLMLLTTAATVAATLSIKAGSIDHAAARGMGSANQPAGAVPSSLRKLAGNRPLLWLALALALFHFGNAPLARLIAQQFAVQMQRPFETTAVITMVSQLSALAAALAAPWLLRPGRIATATIVALMSLPLRGLLAWRFADFAMIYPVQLLDGIGVGLLGILTPFLVERLTRGSGHFNLALAAVMTVQGIGAASSNVVAGYLTTRFGYPVAYLAHGAVALAALAAMLPALRGASRQQGKA
ncbi:MFS transporter [Janthinobacterium aquaticum]|uniref:MFS transporter n=1 Tax=Janthinobacterium sp. FT58W TaxID=2654254 RepID=UPI0012651652|nr:MFS transporter [Janthinobacterium sp. FT58W]KAB8044207.1 MFS transporter [Janthinobacterium sp. FT58W]